jgi:large subunit ribosomal protein L18
MSRISKVKETKRAGRHQRIRKRISGTSERPRLCVHRSLKNFFVQIIDDNTGKILFGISTLNKEVKNKFKYGGNVKGAAALGEVVASQAKAKGIVRVSFDRGGYLYHGRIKAFADAARKGGLEF